jgi:hypothetical protein
VARTVSGIYIAQTGVHLVLASADAALVGRWFLWNPLASGISIALRRIEFCCQHGSALATPTSPRLVVRRFTFTGGTPSATVITAAKRATSDGAQVAQLRVLLTGMTGTAAGADVFAFLPSSALTAVGSAPPGEADWNPDEIGQVQMAPGEGIFLTQVDAGTPSDTRRYLTNIAWEEYTGTT